MRRSHGREVSAAALQVLAGVLVHLAGDGCLPTLSRLVLALPPALLASSVLGRLLPGRPLLRLAGGQLGVHLSLGLVATCLSPTGQPETAALTTYLHVVVVVGLFAFLDRAVQALDELVDARWPRRRRLRLPRCRPSGPRLVVEPATTPPGRRARTAVQRRGPPSGRAPGPLPA